MAWAHIRMQKWKEAKQGNYQTDSAFIRQMQYAFKTIEAQLILKGINVNVMYLKHYSLDVKIGVYYIQNGIYKYLIQHF